MYKQSDILILSTERAIECRKHNQVKWDCDACGVFGLSDNKIQRKQCRCGRWMKWYYPLEVA